MELPRRESVDHTAGRAQHWRDVDGDIRGWIGAIVTSIAQLDDVVGIYLHGSLTMGCFYRPKSDVDVLVITGGSVANGQRRQFALEMVRLFDDRPIIGGLELTVMRLADAASFVHPAPYEFHFSAEWADTVRSGMTLAGGTDRDLATHCAVTRSRGLAIAGPDPATVFGDVPRAAFLDAVLFDLRWIVDGGILESPFYGVLNICRSAHVLLGAAVEPPSKQESALWAAEHLPAEHHAVIAQALECYRSSTRTPEAHRRHHGHAWDEQPLLELAAWARQTLTFPSW